MLDLDLERVAKPHEIGVIAYRRNNTALLRLLHPNIVAHPLIEWNTALTASPTPLALRSESGSIRIYIEELSDERKEVELEPLYSVHYLDPLSIVALSPQSAKHRVFSVTGSYTLELEIRAYAPCTDRSYAATPSGIIALTHSDTETISTGRTIEVRSSLHPHSGVPMKTLIALNDGLLIVSDGIYGSATWVGNLDKYLTQTSQIYLLNDLSIALVSENSTIVAWSDSISVLPKGFTPYATNGRRVIGFFSQSNTIALYDVQHNELQKLFPSSCRLLAFNDNLDTMVALCPHDSKHLLIALELSGSAIVLELNAAPIHAELAEDILLLSYPNRSEVYRLNYGRINRVELLCTTRPLYSCRYLGSSTVACIDFSGRILLVDLKRICSPPKAIELRARNLCAIYTEDSAKHTSLIGRVVPSFTTHKLSLTRSIIEIESPRYQQLYIVATGSVHDTPLLIESIRKVYGSYVSDYLGNAPQITLMELGTRLYIRIDSTNSTHTVVSSRGITYIDRGALLNIPSISLVEIYRVERLYSEPILEFWKRLQANDIRYINLAEKINIALRDGSVCIETASSVDMDSGLEVELVCREGIHIVKAGECIPLESCQNLAALQICISTNSRKYCAPLHLASSITIKEAGNEVPTARKVFDRVVVTLPRSCVSVRYAVLTLSTRFNPMLRLEIGNRCTIPIPIMIVSASGTELWLLDPRKTLEVHIPIDPAYMAYFNPVLVALEPSKPRAYRADIGLRELLALAYIIALKVSLLLGARRWSR